MIYDHPLIDSVYRRSPIFLQHVLVSAYGALKAVERWSPTFRRHVAELTASQWYTGEELAELQSRRLRALIRHTYENVPYYREVFDDRKLRPADIQSPSDLYKLPVLTKQDVRRHLRPLRAGNVPARAVTTGRTGGTTGIPLHFALDKARVTFDHALIHRHWSWAGYRPRDLVVLLRGFTLVDPDDTSAIYWRHDWIDRRTYLSGFHLSDETLPRYVEQLIAWQPKFIAAYPSAIYAVARFLERQSLTIPVAAVFTGSEVLTPTERATIEQRFACKIWDRYGTGERLVVGQQCECGSYHQNAEFGILQVDQPRGEPAQPGTEGELIQTTITNYSMPLIRYASEDIGALRPETCRCGRGLPLMGPVQGRKDDAIITADGRVMPRAGLDQIHEYVERMERCQLVQERVGEIIVRVLPREGFNDEDVASLMRELRKRVGERTRIEVRRVDELPLTVTGKERFIVSLLDQTG
jgi:phenylacetate-CoA ligase